MSRIFVCQIVPFDTTHLNKYISQAANNFCYDVINAISPSKVFSIIPIFINNNIFCKFNNDIITAIYIRFFPHNKIFRFLNVLLENLIVVGKIFFRKERMIWFYNITKHNIIAFFILRFLTSKKCFVILADYNPAVKTIDINNCISLMLAKANGIIALSGGAITYIKNNNLIINPGIVNRSKLTIDKKTESVRKNKFLFCGVLDDHTGIMLALETFAQLPAYELIITGEGKCKEAVLSYSHRFNNIKYYGFLEYAEYLRLLMKLDFLLSLRDSNYIENEGNFPSKIIEAMLNNVCVISTFTYNTLQEKNYFKIDFSLQSLSSLIENIQKLTDVEIRTKQYEARQYVINNFGDNAWLEKTIKIENYIGK